MKMFGCLSRLCLRGVHACSLSCQSFIQQRTTSYFLRVCTSGIIFPVDDMLTESRWNSRDLKRSPQLKRLLLRPVSCSSSWERLRGPMLAGWMRAAAAPLRPTLLDPHLFMLLDVRCCLKNSLPHHREHGRAKKLEYKSQS